MLMVEGQRVYWYLTFQLSDLKQKIYDFQKILHEIRIIFDYKISNM